MYDLLRTYEQSRGTTSGGIWDFSPLYLTRGVTYRAEFYPPCRRARHRDALLASFTIHETFIMSSIIIIAAVWSHASLSEIFLLLFPEQKFQRSAKVSARLKQLVTYVAGTCGGDKVSEFARRLHVAIYKAGRHPTNGRLRIIAFLSTSSFFSVLIFSLLYLPPWSSLLGLRKLLQSTDRIRTLYSFVEFNMVLII